jgi:hypothetical protein
MTNHIPSYSFSLIGKDHLRTNTPCQDHSDIIHLQNGWTIAAIADGVGSASRSDEGSKIAVASALKFCSENFPTSTDTKSVLAMLLLAFHRAFGDICEHAEHESTELEAFDTTLTVACFYKGMLFYGHCGDGGIFVVNRFGEASEITTPQKGEDGDSMIPLRFGAKYWVFGQHSENVPTVLLATDGVRDKIASNDFRDSISKVYVPLLLFLSIISDLGIKALNSFISYLKKLFSGDDSATSDRIYDRLLNVYSSNDVADAETIVEQIRSNNELYRFISTITDDISIAVLNDVNVPMTFDMPSGYFSDPNWRSIREERHRRLCDHLYIQPTRAEQDSKPIPSESMQHTVQIYIGLKSDVGKASRPTLKTPSPSTSKFEHGDSKKSRPITTKGNREPLSEAPYPPGEQDRALDPPVVTLTDRLIRIAEIILVQLNKIVRFFRQAVNFLRRILKRN